MKPVIIILLFITGSFFSCQSQSNNNNTDTQPAGKNLSGMAAAANEFLKTLSAKQKNEIQFDFDEKERYNWHYVPKSRKGVPLKDLAEVQRKAAMDLLHTALSDTGFAKTTAVIQLEGILREAEGRPSDDDYRNPGKYYFSIFGSPAHDSIWDGDWKAITFHLIFLQKTIGLFPAHPGSWELILPLYYQVRRKENTFLKMKLNLALLY